MSEKTGKIEYISNLKAFAILSVIFLHSYSILYYSFGNIDTKIFLNATFWAIMSRYCVPLFLIASGITLLGKNYSVKTWVVDKIGIRILLPFIFYGLLYIFWIKKSFIAFFNPIDICFHFHFVAIILTLYLVYPFISEWVKKASGSSIIYFTVIWLILSLLKLFSVKFTLIDVNCLYIFLVFPVLGYYLGKFDLKKYKYLFLITGLTAGFLTYLWHIYDTYKANAPIDLHIQYWQPLMVILSLGVFLFIKNSDFHIKNNICGKVRDFLADHSYGIFFLHPLIQHPLYVIHPKIPFLGGGVIFLLTTIITCLIIFIALKITDKIPLLNKINRKLIA